MNSPAHRANILSTRARYIGMGVVSRSVGGWLMAYNTMNFNDAFSTAYGTSRVIAAGLPIDGGALPVARYLATFEHGTDLRIDGSAHGFAMSTPRTDVPSAGDNAVRFTASAAADATGYVDIRLRQAIDLTNAPGVEVRLRVDGVGDAVVPMTVLLSHFGGTDIEVGTADVTRDMRMYTFDLSGAAQSPTDAIIVRVPAESLRHLPLVNGRHVVRVSLYTVRVVV